MCQKAADLASDLNFSPVMSHNGRLNTRTDVWLPCETVMFSWPKNRRHWISSTLSNLWDRCCFHS